MPPVVKKSKADVSFPYPEYRVMLHVGEGVEVLPGVPKAPPITADLAAALLGWKAESDGETFGTYHLVDRRGNKILLQNNVKNRPLMTGNVESLVQEILNRRWNFNFEPVIIGKSGAVLNGQHTLIAVVLAEQDRTTEDVAARKHWASKGWLGPVTVEKMICYGCDESDTVVNTMDTCKVRTLADVIYRSPVFGKMDAGKRAKAAALTDAAVRTVWGRTKAKADPFAPNRSHSESMEFIDRHKKILEAVKHVLEENQHDPVRGDSSIGRYVPPGRAAGMLYMMGCSDSDPLKYRRDKGEKSLDTGLFDRACDFWTLLSSTAVDFQEVRHALNKLGKKEDGVEDEEVSTDERLAVICKAWQVFRLGKKTFPKESCCLVRGTDYELSAPEDGGTRVLVGVHSVGGIDMWEPEPTEAVSYASSAKGGEADLEQTALSDDLQTLREEYPDNTPLMMRKDGSGHAWGSAAIKIGKLMGTGCDEKFGLKLLRIPASHMADVVSKANVAGLNIALVRQGATYPNGPDKYTVEVTGAETTDSVSEEPAEPTAADLAALEAETHVNGPNGNGKAKRKGKKETV